MIFVCFPIIQLSWTLHVKSWPAAVTCFIIYSRLLGFVETLNCSQPTTKSLLLAMKEEVLKYSEARPVISLQTPTNVSVDLTLYGILGVNEKSQVLETYLWVRLTWRIEGLSWNPAECGTDKISLPRETIWFPDIVINEFMDENRAPETYYVYVMSDGEVRDGKPFHVISSCKLDIYTFPFDVQNCSYTFNSYKHSSDDVRLFFYKPVAEIFQESLALMATKGEWELISMLGEKPVHIYEDGGWDELIIHVEALLGPNNVVGSTNSVSLRRDYLAVQPMTDVVLRRRAALYVVNLIIPSCFLLSVDLFSFLLPPQHVDRASFKMTLILGYTVFLLLMNDLLPVTGNTLPLINVFFSLCLALMVGSLLETVLITNVLCGSGNFPPLPKWIRVLVLKYIARLIWMGQKSRDQNSEAGRSKMSAYNNTMTEFSNKETVRSSPMSLREECLEEMKKMRKDLLAIRCQVEEHFRSENFTDEWIFLGQVIDRLLFILYFIFITVSSVTIMVLWFNSYRLDKNP